MIKSFSNPGTEDLFHGSAGIKKWPAPILKAAFRKLRQIHTVTNLTDLKVPPGNRLEKLSGDRSGQYSIRINRQFRICFEWRDGNAYDVGINKHYDR